MSASLVLCPRPDPDLPSSSMNDSSVESVVTGVSMRRGDFGRPQVVVEIEPARLGGRTVREVFLRRLVDLAAMDIRIHDPVLLRLDGRGRPEIAWVLSERRPVGSGPSLEELFGSGPQRETWYVWWVAKGRPETFQITPALPDEQAELLFQNLRRQGSAFRAGLTRIAPAGIRDMGLEWRPDMSELYV